MYSRFYRWASDRLGDEGIIAFVNNNSFIAARTFDGFRKTIAETFNEAWVIDLKGNARASGEQRRREGGNVFEDKIKVGVAVAFFVKKKNAEPFRVHYLAVDDYTDEEEKRSFIATRDLSKDAFEILKPNDEGEWLNQAADDEWSNFLPIATKATKAGRRQANAIFKIYSLGISTNRDEWLYSRTRDEACSKAAFLTSAYDEVQDDKTGQASEIKWSETLSRRRRAGQSEAFSPERVRRAAYRPFDYRYLYQSELFVDRPGLSRELFPPQSSNQGICFSDLGSRTGYCIQAINGLADLHFGAAIDAYQQVTRYRFANSEERIDNITDWALKKFTQHYGKKGAVSKDAIFAYCYAVLHDPVYREKYGLNLKREFPRIPFYPDFAQWVAWGETLLALHIDYEDVQPYPLERIDTPNPKRAEGSQPKPKLKSLLAEGAETGTVVVDEDTQLTGIPVEAWGYSLGNRSAIDWVLDQHKEKKPRDPTIAAKFNTYRFADYKESMINLLAKVVQVSVGTVQIANAMKDLDRSDWAEIE
ncbi:type ISP restriction/modification enzyme [Erythrobacter sp. QSSC1-22B]|uniref:type ISP restriction/modification enzyme n=1 Tax=Erythrobacter sp. QSSC1-22B TaxID=1860125 RepID=UPI000AB804B0|nr:type ISP restriction/modification enzyme [Erythrobacter sp. QSSC1-22B]